MAEWLVEQGIGEDRAVLIDKDRIIAARTHWTGELIAGQICTAKLVSRTSGSARGIVEIANGQRLLIDRLPKAATEGASVQVEIVRAEVAERGRLKMAQARPSEKTCADLDLGAAIKQTGDAARTVHRFPGSEWDDLISDALSKEVHFGGGSLLFAATPAMVVIDVDGDLPPRELALAAAGPIADSLRRFDIGGMVGIDFPTIENRADRKAVDDALAAALSDWPHERTAMNGFGFVQIVAQLQRPSLLHRATHWRSGLLVRQLLRKAEAIDMPGAILLTMHPALEAKMQPDWLAELARRSGLQVRIATDPGLALEGGFAQAVSL